MRITIEEKPEEMVLKLEGRLAGPWAAELDHLWTQARAALGGRRMTLDLRETTFADTNGIRTLRTIYKATGAGFLTGSPWTQYLAEEAQRNVTEQDEEV